ncbi:MAG: patatin-like phospholipase family protein [Magnetococcales bacterium]|nr:patatin-like phospholipase family protein [Magnetococcales bacterium]
MNYKREHAHLREWPADRELFKLLRQGQVPSPQDRIGLAISGGGIRSATFGLGIVQYLGKLGRYREFDYLSTVSGGGFLGSCLTSWYSATNSANPAFPFVHDKNEESLPFQHLRNFSNYLAPSGSLLDNARMLAIFIRGLFFNMVLVLPFILFLAAAGITYLPGLSTDFFLTKWLTIIIVVLFTLIHIVFAASRGKDIATWKQRDRATKWIMGGLLVLLGVIFFLELQPHAMELFFCLHGKLEEHSGKLVSVLGTAASSVYLLINKIKKSEEGTSEGIPFAKYGALAIATIVVPLFFWSLTLWLMMPGLHWDACSIHITHNDNSHPYLQDLTIAGAVLFGFGIFFNINKYSLHVFYRDRLSRAYLIKPGQKAPGHNDTLKLSEMEFKSKDAPYHLINAAVNVTRTDGISDTEDDYVMRGRTADFFLFSKEWVGSALTGYCNTTTMEKADPWLNLGTAMAISGAAFSPNMGTFTMKPLTALMTFLNIRLGYWLPNPKCFEKRPPGYAWQTIKELWKNLSHFNLIDAGTSLTKLINIPYFLMTTCKYWYPPRKYLFNEAFSSLSPHEDAFINVSDGGHIENLAIYPLLQRKCRLIVALDGEADPKMQFEGLADTIRLARINLNVHVEMETAEMQDLRDGKRHYATGKIKYYENEIERVGTLIYIKASLCKKEDVDIQHYKACHPEFPHETTLDQFFDEKQFEAYRSLGYHVAKEVFSTGYGIQTSSTPAPLPAVS